MIPCEWRWHSPVLSSSRATCSFNVTCLVKVVKKELLRSFCLQILEWHIKSLGKRVTCIKCSPVSSMIHFRILVFVLLSNWLVSRVLQGFVISFARHCRTVRWVKGRILSSNLQSFDSLDEWVMSVVHFAPSYSPFDSSTSRDFDWISPFNALLESMTFTASYFLCVSCLRGIDSWMESNSERRWWQP